MGIRARRHVELFGGAPAPGARLAEHIDEVIDA